jgi:hypothetical protein
MRYLKITNKGTVERELWELVGATDKDKEDKSLIGFRGSGMKFAIVSALRLGTGVIITSCDSKGPYTLRYFTKETPLGFKQILLDYNRGEEIKTTSFTTNALQDWDKAIGDDSVPSFKILREVIANAYDADKGFCIKEAEMIELPQNGHTSVYLEWRDDYGEVFLNLARYFKFLAHTEPVAEVKIGNDCKVIFYPRSDDRCVRVFIQGVLVYCKKGVAAFDYSIDNKDLLSEERIVKDFATLLEHIYSAINNAGQIEVIEKLLPILFAQKSLEVESVRRQAERSAYNYGFKEASLKNRAAWYEAWLGHFGESAVLGDKSTNIGREVQYFGQNSIIETKDPIVSVFLSVKKVPTAHEIYNFLTEREEVEWEKLGVEERENFKKAVEVFNNAYPQELLTVKDEIPVGFFTQKINTFGGVTDFDPPKIWLNVSVLSEGWIKTLEALAHEYGHVATGSYDYDREFMQLANKVIAELLIEVDEFKKTTK